VDLPRRPRHQLPAFAAGAVPSGFELLSTTATSTGVSVLSLRPTGAFALGTVAVQDGKKVSRPR
jgi:hypothetical protein